MQIFANIQKRFLSAAVMGAIFGGFVAWGRGPLLALTLAGGVIIVDEIFCNFLKGRRSSLSYFMSQGVLIAPFAFLNIFSPPFLWAFAIHTSFFINSTLILYLFCLNIRSPLLVKTIKKFPPLIGLYILFPFLALSSLNRYGDWREFWVLLIIINYGMDTGAWFFGHVLGKHKLWPTVSPNKTIEGVLGGVVTSMAIGGLSWHLIFGNLNVFLVVFFAILGVISQLGDLIQSKLKRQFNIKDSSHLIPGHGGLYDRVDSLVFLTPFVAVVLNTYNNGKDLMICI